MKTQKRDLMTPKPVDRVRRAIHRTRLAARYYLLPRHRGMTPLFILAEPRTGSTLIGDYLNSIPGVSIASEILSPTLPCGVPAHGVSKGTALRHIERSLNALPGKIAGAKFLLAHLPLHDLTLNDLHARFPTARFLIIYRAALIEQFVSFRVAKLTNDWVGRGQANRFTEKIRVEPEEFLTFCRAEREKYEKLLAHDWLPDRGRIIRYEDLASQPQELFDRTIFPFLELPSQTISTTMVKQIARQMDDLIENFDEVRELLDKHGVQHHSFDRASDREPTAA